MLKRTHGTPMTQLLQEALDRYVEPFGGAGGLLEGVVAEAGGAGAREGAATARAEGARAGAPAAGESASRRCPGSP